MLRTLLKSFSLTGLLDRGANQYRRIEKIFKAFSVRYLAHRMVYRRLLNSLSQNRLLELLYYIIKREASEKVDTAVPLGQRRSAVGVAHFGKANILLEGLFNRILAGLSFLLNAVFRYRLPKNNKYIHLHYR